MDDCTAQLLSYVSASPSPYHCVAESVRRLESAGFRALDEAAPPEKLTPGTTAYVRRAGSLIAFRAGSDAPASAGFRLLGAHTDSPNLRLKPRPSVKAHGFRQWGVETYGGVLLYTWFDRDLGVSGRVFVRGEKGEPEARLFRHDEPIARVGSLAIHLNREIRDEGFRIDSQQHLPPIVGLEDAPTFEAWLSDQLGGAEVLSWDLGLHDICPPTVGGIDGAFVFSPRLDNQASCYASLAALIASDTAPTPQVIVLFDHEEVGSRSHSGAMSAFLRDTLVQIERNHTERAPGGIERAIPNSRLISLDMAHGVHPNYADRHEPNHRPVINGGPVVKEHVEQRYATDGETSAWFRGLAARHDIPLQDFVIKTNLACGSTIGPISAGELGIKTIDVGNAMLGMHSIREMAGTQDTAFLQSLLEVALTGA